MHRHIGNFKLSGILFYAVPVLVIVVGVIVPGGAGDTITAVGGFLLAFAILIGVGLPNSMMKRPGRPGQIKRD